MSSPALLPGVEAGLPPASDRMLTTCFLAAVFHGIVILGVTFSSANRDAAGPDGPALEVVLVNEQGPRAAANPHARYVAQRSQAGAGNTPDGRTRIPRSSSAPVDQMGMPGGVGSASEQAEGDPGNSALVATSAPSVKILYFAPPLTADWPKNSLSRPRSRSRPINGPGRKASWLIGDPHPRGTRLKPSVSAGGHSGGGRSGRREADYSAAPELTGKVPESRPDESFDRC